MDAPSVIGVPSYQSNPDGSEGFSEEEMRILDHHGLRSFCPLLPARR